MRQKKARLAGLAGIRASEVRDQLRRILDFPPFKRSERLSHFLEYVVERALENEDKVVREVDVALDVFKKGGSFDSRTDPIVRVEARRLRRLLDEYYATAGGEEPISIVIPARGYTPKIHAQPRAAAASHSGREIKTHATGPSVAVLPFVNMTAEETQDVFCQGVTEELINALTQLENLKVVSRTSSFQFKDRAVDLRTIGKDLGVQTVVEGSLRADGDRLRVTAQLSSAADGFHLWSDTFDATLTDIFQVQESLARDMAAQIAEQLDR